jgi:hypothetical protein
LHVEVLAMHLVFTCWCLLLGPPFWSSCLIHCLFSLYWVFCLFLFVISCCIYLVRPGTSHMIGFLA